MSQETPITATGDFRFDPAKLVEDAQRRWPGAETVYPTDPRHAALMEAYVYLPAPGPRKPELSIDKKGLGLVVEGADADLVAEIAVWVAQATPVPEDGSVVLLEWSDDHYPLTPRTTVADLLAALR